MDFRDLFRGMFGLSKQPYRYDAKVPIDNSPKEEENLRQDRPVDDFFNFSANNRSDLKFDEIFHTMEDMFKEMEDSMRNMESIFQDLDFGNDSFGFGMLGPTISDEPPLLPPPTKQDGNIRDLVLKKDLPVKELAKTQKVDKILDDLFENSGLPLSDVPEAPKETLRNNPNISHGFKATGFERVSSSHSFRNGMWEGKTVRENDQGKEVTTYTRDAEGQLTETSEFTPKSPNTVLEDRNSALITMEDQLQILSPFRLLERIFKPRL